MLRYGINEIYVGCRVSDKQTGLLGHVIDVTDELPKKFVVQLENGVVGIRGYEDIEYLPSF